MTISSTSSGGKVKFNEINFTKPVDRVSPSIFFKLCSGSGVENVIIEYVTPGVGAAMQTTLRIELKTAFFQSLANSVAGTNNFVFFRVTVLAPSG